MSNNVDHCRVLSTRDFRISRESLDFLLSDECEDDLPEGHFLADIPDKPDANGDLAITNTPHWYGEGSGSAWDFLTDEILPMTDGCVELVYIFENGEMVGLCVEDGNVSECDVVLSLGDPKS